MMMPLVLSYIYNVYVPTGHTGHVLSMHRLNERDECSLCVQEAQNLLANAAVTHAEGRRAEGCCAEFIANCHTLAFHAFIGGQVCGANGNRDAMAQCDTVVWCMLWLQKCCEMS